MRKTEGREEHMQRPHNGTDSLKVEDGRNSSSSDGKKATPSGNRRREAKSTGRAVREPGRGRPGHAGLCRA